MTITVTELKKHLSRYLSLSRTRDVYITKNRKIVSKLTNPFQSKTDIAESLFGAIPDDMTLEEAKEEKINNL